MTDHSLQSDHQHNHGCVLCPVLYTLFPNDCLAAHSSNSTIKFADDTTIIGLIPGNDDSAYREEVKALTSWCEDNNLHLNVCKTKEILLDFRRRQRTHSSIYVRGTPVERVNSFKFLKDLKRIIHQWQGLQISAFFSLGD